MGTLIITLVVWAPILGAIEPFVGSGGVMEMAERGKEEGPDFANEVFGERGDYNGFGAGVVFVLVSVAVIALVLTILSNLGVLARMGLG